MESILNTDIHTFMIKLRFKSTNNRFITQGRGLIYCIKTQDVNGIEYIKIFNPVKAKFERISRSKILQLISWHTESFEYLKNHYYFK
jgi:hypothetical protein